VRNTISTAAFADVNRVFGGRVRLTKEGSLLERDGGPNSIKLVKMQLSSQITSVLDFSLSFVID
jgi:hypothetical protein